MLYYQHYLPQGNWLTFAYLLAEQTENQHLCIIKTNKTYKTKRIMKTVETIKNSKNFTAVNVGKLIDIKDYVFPFGEIENPGKVFVGQALQTTGSELSFQTLVPGQDSSFLHTHKTHEELYFILKGEGEYQVDGEVFPVTEGSIIRVAPEGKRALKNTGNDEMLMLCIQYKANSFTEYDAPADDGVILNEELKW